MIIGVTAWLSLLRALCKLLRSTKSHVTTLLTFSDLVVLESSGPDGLVDDICCIRPCTSFYLLLVMQNFLVSYPAKDRLDSVYICKLAVFYGI